MKKLILLITFLMFASCASADYSFWRYRPAATDCTSLTDGRVQDMCKQLTDGKVYVCLPSSGSYCQIPGDWKLVNGSGGGGSGDVTSNTSTSVDNELPLFNGASGKSIKRASGTGFVKTTAGVVFYVTAPTGALLGDTDVQNVLNKTINASLNTLSNISESMMAFSDVTTLNASTSKHGFVPKLPNDATKYYDGTGNYSVPPGSGGGSGTVTSVSIVTANGISGTVATSTTTPAITLVPNINMSGINWPDARNLQQGVNWYGVDLTTKSSSTTSAQLGWIQIWNAAKTFYAGLITSTGINANINWSVPFATTANGIWTDVSGNGVLTVVARVFPTGTILGTTDTQTMSNKRNTPRITTITSSATPAVNTDVTDVVEITAQAADITSMTSSLTGTPVNGDEIFYMITGTAARAITWGASFAASSDLALPTTTTTTKTLYCKFKYSSTAAKWRLMAKLDNF